MSRGPGDTWRGPGGGQAGRPGARRPCRVRAGRKEPRKNRTCGFIFRAASLGPSHCAAFERAPEPFSARLRAAHAARASASSAQTRLSPACPPLLPLPWNVENKALKGRQLRPGSSQISRPQGPGRRGPLNGQELTA